MRFLHFSSPLMFSIFRHELTLGNVLLTSPWPLLQVADSSLAFTQFIVKARQVLV